MILDAIFDTFKSTSIWYVTISTFDINHQLYVSISSFINFLFDLFIDQLFDHQSIINRSISLEEIHRTWSSIKNVIYQQYFKFLKDADFIYERNIVIEIKKEWKRSKKWM
jgi:hypothetical protein